MQISSGCWWRQGGAGHRIGRAMGGWLHFCHAAAALPSPASRAQRGAVQKPGHLSAQGLLLQDDQLQHSTGGAALPKAFPMRLCHLLSGLGGKEGYWGWPWEWEAWAGEPREQQQHQRRHSAMIKTSAPRKLQHSLSFPSQIPSLLRSPLTTIPATFSALLFTQARAFIHKTLKWKH